MSLSKPKLQNPCKKFIEFKGDKGIFRFWNKETKSNEELAYPIKFIILDELNCIKGWSEKLKSGLYSNEVHNLVSQDLNVRAFSGGAGVIGKYADIKAQIKEMGGKFCRSVYAAMIIGNSLELVNFQLSGAAFSSWMDKVEDPEKMGVSVSECGDGKKGAVVYKIPKWIPETISPEIVKQAVKMDEELQDFLRKKKIADFEAIHERAPSTEGVQESSEPDNQEDDKIPF